MSDPFWLGVATGVGGLAVLVVLTNVAAIVRGPPLTSAEADSLLAFQSAFMGVLTTLAAMAGSVFA